MRKVYREVFGPAIITLQDLKNIYVTYQVSEELWQFYHMSYGAWNRAIPKDLDMRVAQIIAERTLADMAGIQAS